MRLVLHRKVYSDIDAIMAHYERVASRELADDFYAELRLFMSQAAARPESFAVRDLDLRRVNLQRFPYISFFASPEMQCESSSSGIIGGIPRSGFVVDER